MYGDASSTVSSSTSTVSSASLDPGTNVSVPESAVNSRPAVATGASAMYLAAEAVRQLTRTVVAAVSDSVTGIVSSPVSSGAVESAGSDASGAAAALAGAARSRARASRTRIAGDCLP